MQKRFDREFIQELDSILRSEGVSEEYGPSGTLIARTRAPFTGRWKLDSLELTTSKRAVARFSAGSRQVIATINSDDFPDFAGKRAPRGFPNSSPYSDLAVHVSELIQERILIHDPKELETDEVHIAP
jgi:hypothetical protein